MSPDAPTPEPGRPVVLRGGTVLTMNDAHEVLADADVLVVGERIEAVGPGLEVPEEAFEIDASGGIVMPGMIDTHRHMWQTALRGYGADWTLAQYFVWFYLEWGKIFRPQDVHAGNLLSAIESLDAGVTTTVDWSHGLQTVDHADAAVDALEAVPGRFVLAYGNLQQGPWEWSTSPDFRASSSAASAGRQRHARLPDGLRRHRRPGVPREGRLRGGARARRARDHARRRVGRDERRRHPAHARARLHDAGEHLRARRHAGRGLLPPHRGHGRLGVRLDRERAERRAGLPADLAAAPARHPRVAVDGHERVVERRPLLGHAQHARRRPLARAPRGPRAPGDGDQPPPARASRWSTGRRAAAAGRSASTRSSAASSRARRPTSC